MEYLNSLDPFLRNLWYIAIPASVIFLIQTILSFVGADATDGVDADFDSDLENTSAPTQLFSLRNLINFLLGFSWTGISFYHYIPNKIWLIALSLLVGLLFVSFFIIIIKQVQKLAEDNSFNIQHTLNQTAEVYLPIPPKGTGKGKVMVSVKGAYHELDAITRQEERIVSNAIVRIVAIETDNLLVVETL
jgi:hypothetical protein